MALSPDVTSPNGRGIPTCTRQAKLLGSIQRYHDETHSDGYGTISLHKSFEIPEARDPQPRWLFYLKQDPLVYPCNALKFVEVSGTLGSIQWINYTKQTVSTVDSLQGKGAMDSLGSSSLSCPTVEERLESMEQAIDRLKCQSDNQDRSLQETRVSEEQKCKTLNDDLQKLKEDHSSALEDLKEDVHVSVKDAANVHGDFGNRISALERAVFKLIEKLEK